MNTEASSSSIIPSSSSLSSSLLAPVGRVAVQEPKEEEEEEPLAVVSSSSSSLQAATSAHLKQETAAVKAEEFGPQVNIDGDGARGNNDWEPGNWCWLLDEHDTNVHTTMETTAPVAVKAEKDAEDETEIKFKQENDDVVAFAPQFVSSLSSSSPIPGIRSTKEETKENNNNHNNKLRRREDEEVTENEGLKLEHEDDATVSSASQFVVSSVSSDPSTTGIEPKKGNTEVQLIKVRLDDDDDDDDDTNNHKSRHSTDRIVTSNRKNDHSGSGDNTITNSSRIDSFDDNWRTGSWCWELPAPHSGSRSVVDVVASGAAGSFCSKRSNKRKAAEHCRGSRFSDGIRNGVTETEQCSLNNSNQKNNHNTTNIAVTNRRSFDKQHHNFFGDDWTTGCWCWAPPNTNSDSNDVALAVTAAAAAAVPPTRTGKQQKGSEQSRESRYSIPSKHQSNIGHHTTNNHTDIDEDDDQHDNHDDDDDDDDGTDSDYDSVDDDDERVSDNSGRKKRSDNKRGFLENEKRWSKMYGRLLKHKKTYKSTSIPKTNGKNARLSKWVCTQRFKYNRNALSSDRIDRLESIGFVWNLRNTYWVEMYKRLLAYKNQFESTCVPESYNTQLVNWVQNQRCLYNTNKLSQDRINQLNSISFAWNPTETQWIDMYDRLVKYKKEYKTTCVSWRYPADPHLGAWVRT